MTSKLTKITRIREIYAHQLCKAMTIWWETPEGKAGFFFKCIPFGKSGELTIEDFFELLFGRDDDMKFYPDDEREMEEYDMFEGVVTEAIVYPGNYWTFKGERK